MTEQQKQAVKNLISDLMIATEDDAYAEADHQANRIGTTERIRVQSVVVARRFDLELALGL